MGVRSPSDNAPRPLRWDLFCRVVDNYGDLGVCRRLALNLATLKQAVRLWVDDAALMRTMAPDIPLPGPTAVKDPGVAWVHWRHAHEAGCSQEPGDVVVEAFGCDPPAAFVERMVRRSVQEGQAAALWINLEHLSAEDHVERSHGLPSPQGSGPGAGLTKWFFYPGFTPRTGGLLREAGLQERRRCFDLPAWLRGVGVPVEGERRVAVFAYPQAPLESLMDSLTATALNDGIPVRLMLTTGPLQLRARRWLQQRALAWPALQLTPLPWLGSQEFDHLLWACDLNLVRGEDSPVRAIWAGQPFIWQFYPQHDGVHALKLKAFRDRVLAAGAGAWLTALDPWWRAWNSLCPWPSDIQFPWVHLPVWQAQVESVGMALASRPSLAVSLLDFVEDHRRGAPSRLE